MLNRCHAVQRASGTARHERGRKMAIDFLVIPFLYRFPHQPLVLLSGSGSVPAGTPFGAPHCAAAARERNKHDDGKALFHVVELRRRKPASTLAQNEGRQFRRPLLINSSRLLVAQNFLTLRLMRTSTVAVSVSISVCVP